MCGLLLVDTGNERGFDDAVYLAYGGMPGRSAYACASQRSMALWYLLNKLSIWWCLVNTDGWAWVRPYASGT